MTLFKCKMCGGSLKITPDATVAEREYCRAKQTLPKLNNDSDSGISKRDYWKWKIGSFVVHCTDGDIQE